MVPGLLQIPGLSLDTAKETKDPSHPKDSTINYYWKRGMEGFNK